MIVQDSNSPNATGQTGKKVTEVRGAQSASATIAAALGNWIPTVALHPHAYHTETSQPVSLSGKKTCYPPGELVISSK